MRMETNQYQNELCGFIYLKRVQNISFKEESIVIKDVNRRKCLSWCRKKQRLTVENYWK